MANSPFLDSFERTLALSQMLAQIRERNVQRGQKRVQDTLAQAPRETAKQVATSLRDKLSADIGEKPKPGFLRQTRYKAKRAMSGIDTLDQMLSSGALDLSPDEIATLADRERARQAAAFNDVTEFSKQFGLKDEDPNTLPEERVLNDVNEVFATAKDTPTRIKLMLERGYVPRGAAEERQLNSVIGDAWQRMQPPGNEGAARDLGVSSPASLGGTVRERADAVVSRWPDPTVGAAIEQAANAKGVPYEILVAVADQESRGGANVGPSPAGAMGMFQFMPSTARQYGVNPNDPISSANGAATYLKYLFDNTPQTLPDVERWRRALTAYNGGEGATKYGAQPNPNRENQSYADEALARVGYTSSAAASPESVAGASFSDEVTVRADTRPLSQIGSELRGDATARSLIAPVIQRGDELRGSVDTLRNQRAAAIQYLAALSALPPEAPAPPPPQELTQGGQGASSLLQQLQQSGQATRGSMLPSPRVQRELLTYINNLDAQIAAAEQDFTRYRGANEEAFAAGGGRSLAPTTAPGANLTPRQQNDAFVQQAPWSPDLGAIPPEEQAKLEQLATQDPMILMDAIDSAMAPQLQAMGIDPLNPPRNPTPEQKQLLGAAGRSRAQAEQTMLANAKTPEQKLKILQRYGVTPEMKGAEIYQFIRQQMLAHKIPLSPAILQLAMSYGLEKDLPTPTQPPATFRTRSDETSLGRRK